MKSRYGSKNSSAGPGLPIPQLWVPHVWIFRHGISPRCQVYTDDHSRDPASLHRYRYAEGNPANYIDPSGQGAATEYAFNLGLQYGEQVAAVYEFGQEVACVYFTLAAGVDVVNPFYQRVPGRTS